MRKWGVLLLLVLASGCNAFRGSVGLGLGVGGSAKVGPFDVGCLGGADISFGTYYGEAKPHVSADLGLPAIVRGELIFIDKNDGRIGMGSLLLLPFYPAIAASEEEGAREMLPFLYPRPFEVAVSAYAGIIAFHLGFDFGVVGRDLVRFVSLAWGNEADDPPAAAAPNAQLPADGLLEAPYHQITPDDLAALESGTVVERTREWARFVAKVNKPGALVAVDDEHYDRWVEPRLGLELAALDPGVKKALGALRATQTKTAFAKAIESRDPCVIEEALASAPLAPVEEQAALEHRRGVLLLEQGELERATWALEDSLRHLDDESEAPAARRRLETARALLAAAPPREERRNAWAGSADMEGTFLGASGTAVWCMLRDGTVLWERETALPSTFSASRVIGVESGLALVEVQSLTGRPWIFALDDGGRTVWQTPLPAALASGSPADQFYVHGLGRLFVGRVDRVLALDAATGRVLWMTCRKDAGFQFELPKNVSPLDKRPPPGPPRRRADGESGFQLRLVPGAVEMRTSKGARLFRFDPRTGEPLRRS